MYDWISAIEARTASQAKYDKDNTVSVHLKFNLTTDRDIINWLWQQDSKQGAIKRLIRAELQLES